LRKIKRLQREFSRRKKGNANREKTCEKLAQAHLRFANFRKNALHQTTSRLTRT
jgi:putative transposase